MFCFLRYKKEESKEEEEERLAKWEKYLAGEDTAAAHKQEQEEERLAEQADVQHMEEEEATICFIFAFALKLQPVCLFFKLPICQHLIDGKNGKGLGSGRISGNPKRKFTN